MTKVIAVAVNTAREAVRDRILYLLLFFALLMIGSSRALALLSIGAPEKILADVGLGSIGIFSVVIAIFMGIGLISREIDRRTIYAVVSKPLSREAFVLGKFLGMLAVIAGNQLVMMGFFWVMLRMWGAEFEPSYAMVVGLSLVEAALMLAAALFFSAVASPLLAAMFTVASYFVGHWLDGLRILSSHMKGQGAAVALDAVRRVFPNLELLNLRDQVVFADPGVSERIASQFGYGLVYGAGYTVAVLGLAALAYRRKDFL